MKDNTAKEYKAPIRGIARLILSLLTKLSSLFLNRIKDLEIRMMASGLLESASKTVDVLSDANPNDADQMRQVMNELVSGGEFKKGVQLELLSKIQKLENEAVRKALTILNANAFPVTSLLTDDDKNNTAQVKEFLIEFLRGEDGIELFGALLSIILPPAYADTLTVLIIEALINWLDGVENDENGAKAAEGNAAIVIKLKSLKGKYEAKIAA